MSYHGRYAQEKPKKKKSGKKILLIVLAVLLIAIVAAVIYGVSYYNRILGKMNYVEVPRVTAAAETTLAHETETEATATETIETEAPTTEAPTEPPMKPEDIINILVVGQAARAGEEHHMADTTILVTINTYTKKVTLSSVLRDTYLKLPDYKGHKCGKAKFTVCYNLGYQWGNGTAGAMEMTNQCLLNNFGIEVDYNVEIDFEGFIHLVNYLGGVEIELTQAEADYLNKDDLYVWYDVEPGLQYLDGMAALSYARMRKAEGDSDSDIKRTARQRLLIETLIKKFLSIPNITLRGLEEVASEVLPMVSVTMTPADITKLFMKVLPVLTELEFESGTIPVQGTYRGEVIDIYEDGIPDSVLQFEVGQNKKLLQELTEGIPAN